MKKSDRRLVFVLVILACFGGAVGLALYALKDNISVFRTPTDIAAHPVPAGRVFRLGGLVKDGSLQKRGDDMAIAFIITDGSKDTQVRYEGITPDLFRAGKGAIARGALDENGVFIATEILAKHDENYMPPELQRGLERAAP